MKKVLLIILILIVIIAGGIYGYNYFTLQKPMNDVIEQDSRNSGIEVSAHLNYYIDYNTLEYNLTAVENNSMADVFRVLLQYAEEIKEKDFNEVILSHKGKEKFKLEGEYFKQLGEEYSWQNPVYTMRTFPENVLKMNGDKAFPKWSGGLLGVMKEQTEDFYEFHKKWYINDYK